MGGGKKFPEDASKDKGLRKQTNKQNDFHYSLHLGLDV